MREEGKDAGKVCISATAFMSFQARLNLVNRLNIQDVHASFHFLPQPDTFSTSQKLFLYDYSWLSGGGF
jgi:hypothetical protein